MSDMGRPAGIDFQAANSNVCYLELQDVAPALRLSEL